VAPLGQPYLVLPWASRSGRPICRCRAGRGRGGGWAGWEREILRGGELQRALVGAIYPECKHGSEVFKNWLPVAEQQGNRVAEQQGNRVAGQQGTQAAEQQGTQAAEQKSNNAAPQHSIAEWRHSRAEQSSSTAQQQRELPAGGSVAVVPPPP